MPKNKIVKPTPVWVHIMDGKYAMVFTSKSKIITWLKDVGGCTDKQARKAVDKEWYRVYLDRPFY